MVRLLVWLLAPVLACAGVARSAEAPERASLLLATTTSVQDSGLLDALLPVFTRESGIRVQAVAVGTGAALRMGAEGNADVLLTHAPEAERALLESGAVERRREIVQNYFVLAGPATDPASVRTARDVLEALRRIRQSGAAFVSRADDSGTHKREVALMRRAGLDPDDRWPGLTRTGSGMGISLQVAGQKAAYILSDIGTFLAFEKRTGLVVLTREEPALRNVYSLLLVSPTRFPRVRASEAAEFESFMLRPDTIERILGFGVERFGRPLFRPLESPSGD